MPMSSKAKALALIAALTLLATAARSDGIGNYGMLGQPTFGGIGGSLAGSGSGPPPTCNGVIDLSKGCALPMLGGL